MRKDGTEPGNKLVYIATLLPPARGKEALEAALDYF
jgi:hypothetical protein